MPHLKYTVLIHPDHESGGYYATVPALPGAVGQGETVEEALEDVGGSLSLMLECLAEEERELTQDEPVEAIRSVELEGWRGRGRSMEKTKLETYVSGELREVLRGRAAEEGRPETELVEEALADYLYSVPLPGEATPGLLERVERYQRLLGTPPLSEEEAMKLAVEEQHAARRERREKGTARH